MQKNLHNIVMQVIKHNLV